MHRVACILLAAGSGKRFGACENKLFTSLRGEAALFYPLKLLGNNPEIDTVCLVVKNSAEKEWIELFILSKLTLQSKIIWCYGGEERQDSVQNGLLALKALRPTHVIIHDGARLALHKDSLTLLIQATIEHEAAALGRKVTDTLQHVSIESVKCLLTPVNRERLWYIETPQGFLYDLILKAHMQAKSYFTDETTLLSSFNQSVYLVNNPFPNPKLTIQSDVSYLEYLLNGIE